MVALAEGVGGTPASARKLWLARIHGLIFGIDPAVATGLKQPVPVLPGVGDEVYVGAWGSGTIYRLSAGKG